MSVFVKSSNARTIGSKQGRFSLLKDKAFKLTLLAVLLGIILVGTNVLVSKKTYKIIGLQSKIEGYKAEQKDLNEKTETILSPLSIRKRAEKLGMVEIENIDEMIDIIP